MDLYTRVHANFSVTLTKTDSSQTHLYSETITQPNWDQEKRLFREDLILSKNVIKL